MLLCLELSKMLWLVLEFLELSEIISLCLELLVWWVSLVALSGCILALTMFQRLATLVWPHLFLHLFD